MNTLLEEPEPEYAQSDQYEPNYLDHDPWTEYEAHEQLGSGED